MSKLIDLDILDKEESVSAVEVIMTGVERGYMAGNFAEELKERIEKIVLNIERLMQDLSDVDTEISRYTLSKINESLKIVFPIIQSDNIDQHSLKIIEEYLQNIKDVSKKAVKKKSINEVKELFKGFSVEELKEKLKNKPNVTILGYMGVVKGIIEIATHHDSVSKLENAVSLFANLPVILSDTNFSEIDNENINEKTELTWDIELIISNNDDSKSIYSLWILLESLKSINGVEIKITDISKGSLITKIKVWFKSDEAKREAEELINSTKKLAKGKLEKDYYENEKNRSETEKIKAEKEKIEKEIELANSKEEKRKKELEIEALEIENENKRLQNERLKLQIFMEKRQALAELLSTEVINSDEYKLMINNELQIHKKENDTIEVGVLKEQ